MLPEQPAGRRYYLFADCRFAESAKDVTDVTSNLYFVNNKKGPIPEGTGLVICNQKQGARYEAGWMSLTRIMLVDWSRVPLTVTCLPLKCLAFAWSSSR